MSPYKVARRSSTPSVASRSTKPPTCCGSSTGMLRSMVGKVLPVSGGQRHEQRWPRPPKSCSCRLVMSMKALTAKRWRPRARGRAAGFASVPAHITVIVSRLPEDRSWPRLPGSPGEPRTSGHARTSGRGYAPGPGRDTTEGASRRERRHPEAFATPETETADAGETADAPATVDASGTVEATEMSEPETTEVAETTGATGTTETTGTTEATGTRWHAGDRRDAGPTGTKNPWSPRQRLRRPTRLPRHKPRPTATKRRTANGPEGQPLRFPLGNTTDWKSRWFTDRDYQDYLIEDVHIREYLNKELERAAVSRVEIERTVTGCGSTSTRPGPGSSSGGVGLRPTGCARSWPR